MKELLEKGSAGELRAMVLLENVKDPANYGNAGDIVKFGQALSLDVKAIRAAALSAPEQKKGKK